MGDFGGLMSAFCAVAGPNSAIVAFIALAAIVVFFVVLALDEGKGFVGWGLKILIGVAGIVGSSSLLGMIFPALTAARCY